MSKNNQFLVPDELGWECNDKLKEMLFEFALKAAEMALKGKGESHTKAYLTVLAAETMDNMYALIKDYQKNE